MCIRSATVRVLIPSLARERGVVRSVMEDAELLNLLLGLSSRSQLYIVANKNISMSDVSLSQTPACQSCSHSD